MELLTSADRTIYFYLLVGLLSAVMCYVLTIGVLFLLKRSGDRRANVFYSVLLVAFGLTMLHNILNFMGVYSHYPWLKFLPIYLTLSFPPLLFYYVKLSLYPRYELRWTDAKHFLLPLGQIIYFWILFLAPVTYKAGIDRSFYNPFFGAAEQGLYLLGVYAYLYFAYRYVRHRQLELKKRNLPREQLAVAYLRVFLRVLLALFLIHTILVVADFIYFNAFAIDFRTVKPYVAFGMLSFAALGVWLGTYGFQVLFWGRRIFKKR